MSGLGFWAADSSDESDAGSVGPKEGAAQVPNARTTGRFEVMDSSSGKDLLRVWMHLGVGDGKDRMRDCNIY